MRLNILLLPLALISGSCYDPGDLGDAPYRCTRDYPECPKGYLCCGVDLVPCPNPGMYMNKCVRESGPGGMMVGGIELPKQSMYTGTHIDPGLNESNCTDKDTEPNNNIGEAQGRNPVTALPKAVLDKLSICPEGDADVFSLDLNQQYARIKITYSIANGDLDLGFFDANGKLVLVDNDASPSPRGDYACIATAQLTGPYYIAIVGAKNAQGKTDMNRYKLTVELDPAKKFSCEATPPDMAMPPEDLEE